MILSDIDLKNELELVNYENNTYTQSFIVGVFNGVGEPLMPEQIQPASIDLRLGKTFLVPKPDATTHLDLREGVPNDYYQQVELAEGDCFVLHPNEFVLGTTLEWVRMPKHLAASVDGRSSIGRLGVCAHVTAGFIDPGFEGQITLEMVNFGKVAVKLWPGFRVCQLVVSMLYTECSKGYQGRYQGQVGATGSRV